MPESYKDSLQDSSWNVNAMPTVLSQPPFTQVRYWPQPFGVRVRCVLGLPCLSKTGQITGVAIEATGAMQPWFGSGPFAKNSIREPAQTLGALMGDLDKHGGTTFVYWGTGDAGLLQPLGFRTADQWRYFSFLPPKRFGRTGHLLPAIKYFTEGAHPLTGRPFSAEGTAQGIFVFLLDGAMEDFEQVREYCAKLAEERGGSSSPVRLILIGFGNQFLENSLGQLHALSAQFGRMEKPIVVGFTADDLQTVPEVAREAVMANVIVAKTGAVFDGRGQEVCGFPSGLPGMLEFYLPANSSSFSVSIDGVVHSQSLA